MPARSTNRCMYHAKIADFLTQSPKEILGILTDSFHGTLQTTAISAWNGEIELLQQCLQPWHAADSYIFFEYDIPRLGKRIDAVLQANRRLLCLP